MKANPAVLAQILRNLTQRLHSGDVYPGTGIGLALVKKGIERMGGACGVELEVGRGSRFWIQLPMMQITSEG